MTTRVLTLNERDTLPVETARADLTRVLEVGRPHIGGLQEWGRSREGILQSLDGYAWTRPARGGGPVIWRRDRYRLRSCKAIRLSGPEYVGRLVGRRSRLGASWATEVVLDDLRTGDVVVVLNAHLTAEVQQGKGYRRDLAHRPRVRRHKRERRRLSRRGRWHLKRGRVVYIVGDFNFHGLRLRGFVSCWKGRNGATLGNRAVDLVFADRKPDRIKVFKTHSDHRAVVCIYQED